MVETTTVARVHAREVGRLDETSLQSAVGELSVARQGTISKRVEQEETAEKKELQISEINEILTQVSWVDLCGADREADDGRIFRRAAVVAPN